MKITLELARILGHLYGDGCLDKNGKMYYINKNQILISNFVKDIKFSFGPDAKVSFYIRPDGVKRVYVEKKIADRLRKEFEEIRTRNKIPGKIKTSNVFIKPAFIQAIFDDEASVLWDKKSRSRRISFAIKNKEILIDIKKMLLEIGINTNRIRKHKTSYGQLWMFTISGQENLEQFVQKVNFLHPKKHLKIKKMVLAFKQIHHTKDYTTSKILNKLAVTPLTIPEIQTFIKKSETHTRRIIKELKCDKKIIRSSKKIVIDKIGRRKPVDSWVVNKQMGR